MYKSYNEHFKKWSSGIKNEALFWDKLFESKGTRGGNPDVFKFRMDSNCPFQLMDDLESVNSKIIDVGSGPYSRIGFCVNDKKLDITLVDPLASIYKKIGEKYNIKFPIDTETGMVEVLHLLYKANSFDLVHMSNSLDHCFNPIMGIMELLYITKVGGKIVLRHSNNEAEKEQYAGFHQWNLMVENDKFIIWRKDEKPIIVNEITKDYAEIEFVGMCEETLFDDSWSFNKVVIRKKKHFEIDNNDTAKLLICLIEELNYISAKKIWE